LLLQSSLLLLEHGSSMTIIKRVQGRILLLDYCCGVARDTYFHTGQLAYVFTLLAAAAQAILQPSQPPHQLQTEWALFNESTAAVPLQSARRV
jgi:hypothetical protein